MRQRYMMLAVALVVIAGALYFGTRLRLHDHRTSASIWENGRETGSRSEWMNQNSYFTLSRHPDYAIAVYHFDSSLSGKVSDVERVMSSLELIRRDFREAYLGSRLARYDASIGRPVHFVPRFVCVILDDWAGKHWYCGVILAVTRVFAPARIEDPGILESELAHDDVFDLKEVNDEGQLPATSERGCHIPFISHDARTRRPATNKAQ